MSELIDIKDMENYNPVVKNGVNSVSMKQVYFGHPIEISGELLKYSVETICCIKHGAMLQVAKVEQGTLWRCPACNEGCIKLIEEKK